MRDGCFLFGLQQVRCAAGRFAEQENMEYSGNEIRGKAMLEAVGIKASYRGSGLKRQKKQVLQGVRFTAEEGQCIGIVGANGTGKSTLLAILAGTQRAEAGQLLYQGKDLLSKANQRELQRITGYVPQENLLMEELSVADNLRLWYLDKEKLKKERETGILKEFGLEEYWKVPVNKLSGGLKKRVSIACALAENPDILIMDEPTAALDMLCKQDIMNYIKRSTNNGKIVIFSTHDETEIKNCDKLYILREGQLWEKHERRGYYNEKGCNNRDCLWRTGIGDCGNRRECSDDFKCAFGKGDARSDPNV